MNQYMLLHIGFEKPTPEIMAAWGEWMGATGAAFVDMGAPVGAIMTVGADSVVDGGGANPVGGYGIVEAPDMAAACEIAKGCPVVTLSGGTVEVGETFEINM